jgi:chromosome segregation ATPase
MTNALGADQRDHAVVELLAAMVRVLSGRTTRAEPGDLTITAVAVESGLKRHYLTHKHTDLKDLFYQLRDHHGNPVKHDEAELKSQIEDLSRRLSDANDQRRKWKTTAETFARAIQVLTVENAQLQQRLGATVTPLSHRGHEHMRSVDEMSAR